MEVDDWSLEKWGMPIALSPTTVIARKERPRRSPNLPKGDCFAVARNDTGMCDCIIEKSPKNYFKNSPAGHFCSPGKKFRKRPFWGIQLWNCVCFADCHNCHNQTISEATQSHNHFFFKLETNASTIPFKNGSLLKLIAFRAK